MNTKTHYRTCNLCEAMCGLEIQVEGDHIVSIRGDKNDPFSFGHICPKAVALQDIYHDPDRLKQPMRRTADGWQPIGWEEAFEEVVNQIQRIQAQYGRHAVGIYQGNPNVHNVGSILYGPTFTRALRTKNRFSATSVDQLPHHVAAYWMFGHYLLMPVPDIDRTQFWLILGANPVVSNGSLMTAAGVERRLKKIQKRGGKVVVVDPRRTETAVLADQHLFIRPGSDAFLLLAMLHTVFAEDLAAAGRLMGFVDGWEQLPQLVAEFTPEVAAEVTGIAAEEIRQLTRAFCAAESAVCYGRIGVSTQAFGGLCHWLINTLNLVTGNFDRPGGAMFTQPAFDVVALTGLLGGTGSYGRWRSRVRGLPEVAGELPVAVLAEEILTPGEGQIKAMITVAGNPVLSTPNGVQLDRALAGLEFMVAIDIYINETTRHAHIILPPTTGLETDHYDLIFHLFAVRNSTKYSPALFPLAEGAKHDWQIFQALRHRLEGSPVITRQTAKYDFLKRLPPHKVVDLALRLGPYGKNRAQISGETAELDGVAPDGLKLPRLKRAVHGIDLGPLRPCLPGRLFTANKRIQLAPDLLVADLQRLKQFYVKPETDEPSTGAGQTWKPERSLLLIGRRQLRSNNSWMHNSLRLVRGKTQCTLLIHPEDAAARHIVDGQEVVVCSRIGRISLPAEVTEEMMPGVVSIPHGWGHGRPGVKLETAVRHPGASINDLTDEQLIDELTGNAAFSGVWVTVGE